MNTDLIIKYLEFLKKECLRYQNDKRITEDEIHLFTIEIDRFLKKVENSLLSDEIKQIVLNIDFDLDDENHHKPKHKWLSFIGDFGAGEIKTQMNRAHRFDKLFNDLDAALFKIKMVF